MDATERDRHMQLVTNAFERGLLGPGDYELRIGMLEAAGSVEEMRRIVIDMPLAATAASGTFPGVSAFVPGGTKALRRGSSDRRRAAAVLVVVLVLVALMVLGILLVASAHPATGGQIPLGGSPLSLPSPRR